MTVAEEAMARFTDEQAAAIVDDEGDLLLSAAAGSGKTAVLVERFVRHVRDHDVAPGRILAITFTEKAAGELRQRVRTRLFELGMEEAAREAEGAWISTIHGFCARLLRSNAVAAGLDPDFAVLDESTARELREQAWHDAFGAWLDAGGAEALELSASFGADQLRTAIGDVHDALRSSGSTEPRLPVPAAAPVPDRAELLAAAAAASASLSGVKNGSYVTKAQTALDRCASYFASLPAAVVPPPAELERLGFKAGGAAALKDGPPAAYRDAHERFAAACAAYRGTRAAERLAELLTRYADAYAAAKRSRSALDFDDLELFARDLLRAPAVRASWAARFERIMVDEFQDSNPLQLELFELLGRGNVVVVGDEHQAIYGFRHADVEVFRRRGVELAARGRTRALTRNFRSRPEILAAVNTAFAARFGESFRLVAGRDDTPSEDPRVELLLTATTGWDEVDLGDLPRAAQWRKAEARLLAQRVKDLVDGGDAAPEDVVVLLRSLTDLPVFERALEDAGLQTMASGGRGYWGRQVVRDLCAWLAALANPRDEEQLYGVLASPLVGASTDALALIAEARSGNAWRAIEAAFLGRDGGEETAGTAVAGGLASRMGEEDRERIAAFADRFAAERRVMARLPLDVILRRAVEASDYDLHVLRLPGGARRLANVNKLLRLAAEHERAHGRDVRALADRAAAELEAEARETDAPVELGEAKAVRLMTMHAAKGLEFPVVCVADLGRGPANDTPALVVDGDRLGLRLAHLDGCKEHALDFVALTKERRDRDREEEDRVHYVALTRAEERLIVSGGLDLAKFPEKLGSAPIGWLADALLGGEVPGDEEPIVLAGPVRAAVNTPATVGRVLRTASLAPAGATLPTAAPPPARPAAAPPALPGPAVRSLSYSALQDWRRCGYRFYLERVLRLPREDQPEAAPRAAAGAAGIDALTRGSLVHDALERLDLTALAPEPVAEALKAAASRAGVRPTAGELADMTGLVTAFAGSPLAARVLAGSATRREHPFTVPLGDVLLTGVVDVLTTEQDGALVVDYKTDRLAPDADLEAHVDRDYGVQRRAYALAVLQAGHAAVEVAYAFLERPGEPIVAPFVAADAPRLATELQQLAAGALGRSFEVAAEPHIDLCAGCPGRRALCSHPEELTGRELPAARPPGAPGARPSAEA